jgi:hypothetical protein
MSTPTDQLQDPSGPSIYAPKWAREGRQARPTDSAPGLVPDEKPATDGKSSRLPTVDAYPFPFEGDAPGARLRARRLDPDFCPPPPVQVRTRSTLAVVARLVVVAVVAAAIALFAIDEFPWRTSVDKGAELASAASRPAPAERVAPRIVASGGQALPGEPASLGVKLEGNADGANATIHGLTSGMIVSMGEAFGANSWRVAATDLPSTWVLPPQDFAGTVELGIELRLADDSVADRRIVRLEWGKGAQPARVAAVQTVPIPVAPPAQAAARSPASQPAATPSAPAQPAAAPPAPAKTAALPPAPAAQPAAPAATPPAATPPAAAPAAAAPPAPAPAAASPAPAPSAQSAPTLDREEIAILIKRGEDFIAAGDLAAARIVLRRAAEAGDAGAALALAATYDPIVLTELKAYGFAADVEMARTWYQKAKEFGSAEAPRRLEMLASQAR